MKRFLLLTIFFIIISSGSKAQFSIGVQGGVGVSFTKSTLDKIILVKNHPLWTSPIVGLTVNAYFGKQFSLQSEILYKNEGYGGFFRKNPLDYIHFPEMIRYNIPLNTVSDKSFFIEAGPYFSYCCHYSYSNFIFPTGSNNLSRTDIGVVAGIGYKQQWGKGQIDFCIKFEHNFLGQDATSIDNTTEHECSNTSFYKTLSLTVGYSLEIKTIKKLLHPDKHGKKK